MARKRMTVEEMEQKYPNMWLFIVNPENHEGTTQLKSGIVQIHDMSRDKVYEASRKYKGDAAIRFMGDDSAQRQRTKMTSYRPRNLN